ncbi:hypothetical protein [Microbacterium sp.]|uniref:hypothetical protein n=1 Tax=Microbacterium sp. TaxID=51671 RepID=UPI0039E390DA
MNYSITLHDAVIPPENFGKVTGIEGATVQDVIEFVGEYLTDRYVTGNETDGIDLSDSGFYDHASYDFEYELRGAVLVHCKPGAFMEGRDAEEGAGERWRWFVKNDYTLGYVAAEITVTWPEMVL